MTFKIPLFKIYNDEDDINYVSEKIKSGMYWAEGPATKQFEDEIADYSGSRHCIVFNNGTSALHATLLAYGISKGDEVIVPSFTFISTCNSVLFVGARPVFCDIEDKYYGIDPEKLKVLISEKTKAVIPVHIAGTPCKIKEIREICEEKGILLIEDAAESFGAECCGQKTGTFGDCGMLSFCQNKIITTGEGGAIITDSKELDSKLRLIRSHGRSMSSDYFTSTGDPDYILLGYNFRMSDINAALGRAQLKKAENIIAKRRKIAETYFNGLKSLNSVLLPEENKDSRCVYQLYSIRCKFRNELKKYLEEKGVMSKIYFNPVHKTSFYKKSQKIWNLPETEKIADDILAIPLFPDMKKEETEYVIDCIKNFYKNYE